MASVGNPRSYMIHSSLSWSVVLNADVESTMSAYMSCLKSLASSEPWIRFVFDECSLFAFEGLLVHYSKLNRNQHNHIARQLSCVSIPCTECWLNDFFNKLIICCALYKWLAVTCHSVPKLKKNALIALLLVSVVSKQRIAALAPPPSTFCSKALVPHPIWARRVIKMEYAQTRKFKAHEEQRTTNEDS